MIEERKKLLSELGKTSYGIALKEYLDEELKALKDLQTIDSYDEVLGRKKAENLIKKIFSFMENKKEVEKIKNQYT